MDKIKWIIGFIVILLWTFLSFVSGDYLDWIDKDKACPEIVIKDSNYTKPLPPQTAQIKVKRKAKPIIVDTSVHISPIYGDEVLDSLDWSPHIEDIVTSYGEIIDSTVIFGKDSLDFVAEISFDTKGRGFSNFFDFNLRTTEKFKEVVKEVLVPMKPEIYQNEWVIALIALTAFLFGLVF